MKVGMEKDRVEEIDRELERTIAAAAEEFFSSNRQDPQVLHELERLAHERIELTEPQFDDRLVA